MNIYNRLIGMLQYCRLLIDDIHSACQPYFKLYVLDYIMIHHFLLFTMYTLQFNCTFYLKHNGGQWPQIKHRVAEVRNSDVH